MRPARFLVILLLPLAAFADGRARILVPAEAAGGTLSLSGPSAVSGGVAEFPAGTCRLGLEWCDLGDAIRTLTVAWTVDVPEGDYRLGAERAGETLVFALTRAGDRSASLRSASYRIGDGVNLRVVFVPSAGLAAFTAGAPLPGTRGNWGNFTPEAMERWLR
jgi:hypothetical protein